MYKNLNFSLWCDFIERDFLDKGFKDLISNKIITGATSNPAIFEGAFKNSEAYKSQIQSLQGKDKKEIYEELAIYDIKKSADILKPLHDANKNNGFISIEVDPSLSDDTEGTYVEGMKLFEKIGMDNVMIKVPATDAGYSAMKKLINEGVNVNATLIFSPTQAKNCLDSFSNASGDTKSVISIFVSRFDRKLDDVLSEKGKLGIYNATKIYKIIEDAKNQNVRTLFASTGVKGDVYKPTYYIEELLYENVINTAPLGTIESFINEDAKIKNPIDDYEIERFFNELKKTIDIKIVYNGLLSEGLDSFKKSFKDILHTL